MIELKVDAKHKIDHEPVKAPIKAEFNGTKSLEPVGTPVEPPAKFDFKAGPNPGDTRQLCLHYARPTPAATSALNWLPRSS